MFAIREEVSTHSRPKAAGYAGEDLPEIEKFQHTAARRRLERLSNARYQISRFNTQPPEGGWPKNQPHSASRDCFNTQPPEGGWPVFVICHISSKKFQHTAARRRLVSGKRKFNIDRRSFNTQPPEGGWINVIKTEKVEVVSTHSRPKAAGGRSKRMGLRFLTVSTHSRPKAAGIEDLRFHDLRHVSTHSRPKAAGCLMKRLTRLEPVSTHSRPKAAG